MPEKAKKASIIQDGLQFECVEGCIRCCALPGKVFFFESDVLRLAAHLGETKDVCISRHLKRFWGDIYEFSYPDDQPCHFLGESGCKIYDARPTQCRTFPFWQENIKDPKSWATVKKMCPGIDRGKLFTIEEITDIVMQIKPNPFL